MDTNINVEKILVHGTEEELNNLKSWMFQENIRLELERQKLEEKEKALLEFEEDLESRKLNFIREKQVFLRESDVLKHKMTVERQKLAQDNLFFDKKMDILKSGFADLEADRQKFEREKEAFYRRMEAGQGRYSSFAGESGSVFFKGVNNILSLKKRYRDLCKIFHPDNIAGDKNMFTIITEEYERLLEQFKNRMAN